MEHHVHVAIVKSYDSGNKCAPMDAATMDADSAMSQNKTMAVESAHPAAMAAESANRPCCGRQMPPGSPAEGAEEGRTRRAPRRGSRR